MPRDRDYDEDDDDDRPSRRRRRRDDDDDDDDDEDDDDDDRPRSRRRRRDDDDDDAPPIRRKRLTGLDSTYADTSIVMLILFGLCCGWLAVILSAIALVTCKDPTAKRNATIVLIVAGVMALLHTAPVFMRIMAGNARF